jgi:hypothetical protein
MNQKKIDKQVQKIVSRFIPAGYWVWFDGEHTPMSNKPKYFWQKIPKLFGAKWKNFNE